MKYVGLHAQISRNNSRSALLLIAFPLLIFVAVYAFCVFMFQPEWSEVNYRFLTYIPFVVAGVIIWFLTAFATHSSLIQMATNSKPLERKENMRIYNLTENLCMSVGMTMPKLFIIESDALNAFASGINEKTFSVTLTRGIIEKLNDQELEGVIAHELTHIRNKDVRLLIITIIFVGIFAFAVQMLFRSVLYGGAGRRKSDGKDNGGAAILVMLVIAAVVYGLSMVFKFALSRKREYLADAGAVEMTKNPLAMANALRQISGNSDIEAKSDDVKQMFIDNSESTKGFMASISGVFATHPPIEKRIAVLEQM
ncbi:MAG: M48 family metallopeptidase [Crocinitomicaceae bacterium]